MPSPSSTSRPGHVALVVGIDDYPYVHARPLRGCRNDARRIGGLLQDAFGFQVRLLLDEQATRDGLLAAMAELEQDLDPGDRVVFHFSGHGSRIVDPSGGAVETLLPQDSGRGEHPNRDVTDRELFGWLSRLSAKTPYVTLVMDSCHAGGIVRDLEAGVRGIAADDRPGALAGKGAFRAESETVDDTLRGNTRDPGASGWLPWSDRYTLIAACQAEQSAREIEDPETDQAHGALTYYLAKTLSRIRGAVSYRDVFEPVSASILARFGEQNPQLEGAWDRELFGDRLLVPMRFVPVRSRQGRRLVLDGGAAHGLVAGSECEVYDRGTHRAQDARPLGRIRVGPLRVLTSEAELLDEVSEGAVNVGARAVEVARPARSRHLPVRLVGPPGRVEQLARRIARSPLLERAGETHSWTYTVHLLEPRGRADTTGAVAQLGRLAWPTWAVVDGSGRLVMAPKPASSPEALDHVLHNLELWARYRSLLELEHPDPKDPLEDLLSIELYRRPPGGSWTALEPGSEGHRSYQEGDRLGIRVQHGHEAPLHLAVLDLGLTGAVHLLYPVRGRSRSTSPQRELEIGLDDTDPIEMFVPKELPYPGETFEEARETLVFLATTEETDLSLLSQEGVRSVLSGATRSDLPAIPAAKEPTGSLSLVLRQAITGHNRRDARQQSQLDAPALWTVKTESFWLRRPGW